MEEYLRSLQKQLRGFAPEEQAALMDEIRSHVESGETDPQVGEDARPRGKRLLKELGSPEDMGNGFRQVYRPNRLADYLLVALPYIASLYFTAFYMQLRPQYPWVDIRLNVILDLALIGVGLYRRSALVTLFWINLAVMQLSYIVLQGVWQPYWYYGMQTILWAILLVGLLGIFAQIVWRYRGDSLTVVYAVLPLAMEVLGNAAWNIKPVSYIYNPLDRSLLVIFLQMQAGNAQIYGTLATMAVFFLASNRDLRWLALAASALIIGLGREYLFDYHTGTVAMVAQWVYYLYILVPLAGVGIAWGFDWIKRRQVQLAV